MEPTFLLPAFLFPAITLIMVNFGNRYSHISSLIRQIYDLYISEKKAKQDQTAKIYMAQLVILRRRLRLIQLIQAFSASSFLVNLVAIYVGFFRPEWFIELFLLASGALISAALVLFILELALTERALNTHLSNLEDDER